MTELLVDPEWKKDKDGNFKLYLNRGRSNRIDDLVASVYDDGNWQTWTYPDENGCMLRGDHGNETHVNLAKAKCIESLKRAGLKFADPKPSLHEKYLEPNGPATAERLDDLTKQLVSSGKSELAELLDRDETEMSELAAYYEDHSAHVSVLYIRRVRELEVENEMLRKEKGSVSE